MDYKKLFKELSEIRQPVWIFFVLTLFLTTAFFINFQTLDIYDPDSFYHIRHSWLLRENGIFNTDFPWTQYSMIKELGADLWYGFHLLLMPFTFFDDLTLGIKFSGVFITFSVLSGLYIAFRNLKIRYSEFWPIFFVFLNYQMTLRMAMTRPHPLSLMLSILIFSFLIRGSSWWVFIFSVILAWIHSSLFWLPFVSAFFIILFKFLADRKIDWSKITALIGGIALGLLARPHPIGNLKLVYIQVIELYKVKGSILASTIGTELQPPYWTGLGNVILPILILLGVSFAILIKTALAREQIVKDKKIAILSSLSMVFVSILMFIDTRRAIDLISVYAVMLSASVLTYYLSKTRLDMSSERSRIMVFLALLFAFFTMYNSVRIFQKTEIPRAIKRLRFEGPAVWLRDNTHPGDIVFHPQWDQFPSLFFWNQSNYFINGMDPIFLYKYRPDLYWKIYYITRKDMAGLTCGVENCGPDDNIELVYDVLVNDFKASYVFTRRLSNPRFLEYLEADTGHFKKVYDQELSVIFKILLNSGAKK